MDKNEVESKLQDAITKFEGKEKHLLKVNTNERSITHKLAEYLQVEFEGWNVDCEYNRIKDLPKMLSISKQKIESDDEKATTVYPDIIVHKRGKQENLLVIEAKKVPCDSKDRDYDIRKLKAFKEQLGYDFAVFLEIDGDKIEEPEFIE